MRVFIDGEPIDLVPGATVRHALLRAGATAGLYEFRRVLDSWGNEVGLDGELSEGECLYTGKAPRAPRGGKEVA